jgi:hypothetical protein
LTWSGEDQSNHGTSLGHPSPIGTSRGHPALDGRARSRRGALVDDAALVEALESGQITAAGLDVFTQEPLPPDAPILRCRQVVLTPHNADSTPEGIDFLNEGAVDNALAFLEGRPQNVVT